MWKSNKPLAGLALALLLGLPCQGTWAQSDELETSFKRLTPTEEASLRAILAEPVPTGSLDSTLERHFAAKELAAQKLAEIGPILALYRQWVAASPATVNWSNYSNELNRAGETEEALRVRKEAVERKTPGLIQELIRNNLVRDLYYLGRIREAQDTLAVVHQNLKALQTKNWNDLARVTLLRVWAEAHANEARIHARFGERKKAVEAASHAVELARSAFKVAQGLPVAEANQAEAMRASNTLVIALTQKKAALQAAGQYEEAEETLREFQRLASTYKLQPHILATLYQFAGALRQALREFAQAERYFQRADQVSAGLGYAPTDPVRTGATSWRIAALEGQHRWTEALAELDQLDALAQGDTAVRKRTRFPLTRGYAYLHAPPQDRARLLAAVDLFRGMAADEARWYPAHHFLVAQANGLHGVALWRTGDAQSQARALALLKQAVHDYMEPDNVELETAGLGKDIRDLIFATYLEALFATPGENPMEAMGPADWVRGGMVQEALADAAVRASATDPALADLVRKDQDAKNETEALRKFLAGESDGAEKARAALPDVAAQMHKRIAELDGIRRALQAQTKAQFPSFDRLLRPTPPGAADVVRGLGQDEALVLLLPTDEVRCGRQRLGAGALAAEPVGAAGAGRA